MAHENIPLEIFVATTLAEKQCMQITDSWPVKMEMIQSIVVKHFQDLGIFSIGHYDQKELMRKELVHYLKNSPVLLDLIEKARKLAAQNAARNRMVS